MQSLIASILLAGLDTDLIPVGVIVFGGTMSVIITLLHGAGLDRIAAHYKKRARILREKRRHPRLATLIFGGTVLLMLFLHTTEVCLWGLVLSKAGLVDNLRNAIYFSANTYTTLGMGVHSRLRARPLYPKLLTAPDRAAQLRPWTPSRGCRQDRRR